MKTLILLLFVGMAVAQKRCLSGWTRNGEMCYKLFGNPADYFEAKGRCSSLNSLLVKVENDFQNKFIFSLLEDASDKSMWIGFNQLERPSRWEWGDQTIGKYTNWDVDNYQPRNYYGKCAVMAGDYRKWYSESCEKQHAYVCQRNF